MKKFFDFGLYRQGLRRLRLPGLIFAVVVTVLNALIPFSKWMSYVMAYGSVIREEGISEVENIRMAPFAVLYLLFAPILMMAVFRFLFYREESDVYHAIPAPRTCVFFSFTAAVLTYVWGGLLATFTLNTVMYLACPFYVLSATKALIFFLSFLLGTLIMTGLAGIAVSLTGTKVSAFFVGTILTFFFRLVSYLFLLVLEEIVPVLTLSSGILSFFAYDFFLPLSLVACTFDGIPLIAENPWCLVYNLLLAAAFLLLGAFCYKKRASETANRPTVNGLLQTVCRTAAALPFALFAVMEILLFSFGQLSDTAIAVFLVLSLLTYFLYELITVRQFRALLPALKQLPILAGICVVFAVVPLLIRTSVLSYCPSADEITHVQVVDTSDYIIQYDEYLLASCETGDASVCSAAGKALANTLSQDKQVFSLGSRVTVRYTMKTGRKILRNVYFNDVSLLFSQTAEYREKILSLPDRQANEVSLNGFSTSDGYCSGDSIDGTALLDTFYAEYATLTDEQKWEIKGNTEASYDGGYYLYLSVRVPGRWEHLYSTYAIFEYMPQTRALMDKLCDEYYKDTEYLFPEEK